jgi:ABC-type Mn2+/Zn2+ transport system ATPase subunit
LGGGVLSGAVSHATGAPLLRARGLSLGYGSTLVLRGVDVDVHAGEIWYLVGANGSGKTTFLRAALGLLAPRAGTLVRDPARMAGARVGFVPQTGRIGSALPTTVREIVSLGFAASDVPRRERAARLAWALGRTGLVGLERRAFDSLSGGQTQRTLLARALVRRPSVLALDEPTEALDASAEQDFVGTLEELHRGDPELTMLVVTHELELAARAATHLGLFHDGTVLAGPRDRVLEAASAGGEAGLGASLMAAARPRHPHAGDAS